MLWVVLLAVFSLLFGVWGYLAARSRGRTPIVWALVCAFTFFIGIAIVYSLGDPMQQERGQRAYEQDAGDGDDEIAHQSSTQLPAVQSAAPLVIETGESADDRRWRYLCEYHPRISEAVRRIEPLGLAALDELKSAYLALNDVTLLPGILRRLDERFGGGQRSFAANADFGRVLAGPSAGDEDEPIDLHMPPPNENVERSAPGLNGGRPSRLAPPISATEAPPMHEYRSLRETSAEAEREQTAWRSVFDKDRVQRADAAGSLGSTGNATPAGASSQPPQQERPAERVRLTNAVSAGPANGAAGQSLMKENPVRTDWRDDAAQQQRLQPPPPPPVHVESVPATRPPEHRTVSPTELVGARFVETFGGLHLFALADGRVFVDRHEALGSLELARTYVDGLKPKHAEA